MYNAVLDNGNLTTCGYLHNFNMFLFSNRVVKKSRDEYVKRLNGIYENNLGKVSKMTSAI